MHKYTPANSIFDGPVTNPLSVLYVWIEILLRARAQGGRTALMVSDLAFLLVVFRVAAQQA